MGTAVHCLPEWQAPVWVLTGFACYSARKSRSYFSNPDPYAKVKPRPDDAPKREFSFDEKGNIVVKNPSAFWLPDVKIVEEHGGTEYTVTGSY